MGVGVAVQLIGDFRVTVDGRSVDASAFDRRSGAELIQLLALVPDRRLHREQVFDRLWPDATLDAAANRLHKAASFARKALESPNAIVLRGDMVTLFQGRRVRTDIDALEAIDLEDPAAIRQALDNHVGDVLGDSIYAEWTAEPRRRVQALRITMLTAARRWRDLLEIEPAHERAHLELMQEAVDRGDRTAAVAQHDALSHALETELGVAPSADAERLLLLATDGEQPLAPTAQALRVVLQLRLIDFAAPVDRSRAEQLSNAAMSEAGATHAVVDESNLMALFPTVSAAVRCAIECQRALQEATWARERPKVIAAIDVGEVTTDGSAFSGPGIDRPLRILEVSSGDQIICTAPVADLARRDLQGATRSVELGRFRLPDFPPTSLWRITSGNIVDRQTPLRTSRLTGNIVGRQDNQTVGRDQEVADSLDLIDQARIVTVVGPGGAGKTHLAKHLGARVESMFSGGVWMCELSGVTDGAGAQHEVLTAIGSQHHANASVLDSIARSLGDRTTLLILDNCEHLIEPVRHIADTILQACPNVRLLATSRTPLGHPAEVICTVGPLDPDAARQLFINTARRQGADIDPGDSGIDRICEQLDNLPLAVQLAAARSRTLDVATIETLVADRFRNLRATGATNVEHHRTLRASIAWSVDALDPELRGVLIDLTTLANRFDLAAAMSVARRPSMADAEVLDGIDELARRSLMQGPEHSNGRTTYRLLESVRIYANEQSSSSDAPDRHAICFVERVEAADALMGTQPAEALRRIRSDWDDLRIAVGFLHREGRFRDVTRLLGGLAQFINLTQGFELLEWCDLALDADNEVVASVSHARALASWASLFAQHGNGEQAIHIASRAHAAYPDDVVVLWALAYGPWTIGDLESARSWLEILVNKPEGTDSMSRPGTLLWLSMMGWSDGLDITPYVHELEVLAVDGDPVHQAVATLARGIHDILIDPVASLRALDQCISISDAHDVGFVAITARSIRALSVALTGTTADAIESTRDCLIWSADRGMWAWSLATLATAASVLQRCDRPDLASTLLSARSACGYDGGLGALLVEAQTEALREHHPEQFPTWWDTGQRLDAQRATSLAVAGLTEALTTA